MVHVSELEDAVVRTGAAVADLEQEGAVTLVKAADAPEQCADVRDVIAVSSGLAFPGYGATWFGEKQLDGGISVAAFAIEIPYANADRHLVYVNEGKDYRLVDDAVLPEEGFVSGVIIRDGKVAYLNREGKVVAERPMRRSR